MATSFDAAGYKATTRDQWDKAAPAWNAWGGLLRRWLGPATETMLDMAQVGPGATVLDIAAGAGDQTIQIAQRVGSRGQVLATDISAKILDYCKANVDSAGFTNVRTLVADGEALDVPAGGFDAAISRVGLIYFPDQHMALSQMYRALRPGGRIGAIVYATAEENRFFSVPVGIIRRRAALPPPLPGQPGPFSLGAQGAIEAAYKRAGFSNIRTVKIPADLIMTSASECLRFQQESFGALHQMLSGLDEAARRDAWSEIEAELSKFEGPQGFSGPCTLLIAVGQKKE